ncbi:MAG: arginine--tRNA ligase, partial [Candidatus Diapherotrites archaeon]|nr:arginine--tRNA ligase [Candidatus Diapherotrites archaeon]
MSWTIIETEAQKILLKACKSIKATVKEEQITLSEPPSLEMGDVSSNLPFILAKQLKRKPQDIAVELNKALDLKRTYFTESKTAGAGYVNLYLNYDKAKDLLKDAISKPEKYGTSTIGKKEKVLVEYSSPNIAKPMSVGHFRATILGDSLYRVLKSQGYNTVSDNHLGDFGTQFGKLIIAIEKWGDKKKIEKDPINELLKLYIKFHDESEKQPALEDEARQKTKELEDDIINERKTSKLYKTWALAEKLSLKEFEKTYERLGTHFDLILGEAFFAPMMKKAIKEVTTKGITETQEDGSVILNLKPHGLPNTILLRKDGGSVYITRDIPCFIYRSKKLKCDKIIYVVGKEQNLQFQQLFKTMELLGYKTQAEHVSFGHFRLAEGKMSTRKGTAIKIDDLINDV